MDSRVLSKDSLKNPGIFILSIQRIFRLLSDVIVDLKISLNTYDRRKNMLRLLLFSMSA